MSEADDITSVICPNPECGARIPPSSADDCPVCKNSLMDSQRKTVRLALAISLAREARIEIDKLRLQRHKQADALATEGERLVAEILAWPTAMPDSELRHQRLLDYADWIGVARRRVVGLADEQAQNLPEERPFDRRIPGDTIVDRVRKRKPS